MNEKLAERPALIDAAIANRMKRFREQLGLSQSRLGLKIALNGLPWWKSATVGITEAGRRKTHIYELAAIAKVFDLTVEEFLTPDPAHDDEATTQALLNLSDQLWPKTSNNGQSHPDTVAEADLQAQGIKVGLVCSIANKLGSQVDEVGDLAEWLWEQSPGDEMRSRLGMPLTAATPQARGHVTRQLIKELRAELSA